MALLVLAGLPSGALSFTHLPWASVQPAAAAAPADPVLAVGGDIGCKPGTATTSSACQQQATSDLVAGLGADAVLPLGDQQYEVASSSEYQQVYDPTWGRVKGVSRPIPGNHEYLTSGAAGYFGYFGTAAGDSSKGGYYSWDIGAWHLIALNSQCSSAPQAGCAAGSPQEQWLRADLAANRGKCTLAYWHEPRFSSGNGGSNTLFQPFWQALQEAGADVVLNGHTHAYERFAPQNAAGTADPTGPRSFVVGTGGVNLQGFTAALPNEQVRQNNTFGVMKLTLHASSYDWNFLPVAGQTFTDSGSGTCHSAPPSGGSTGIVNGDFEGGSLSGWTPAGAGTGMGTVGHTGTKSAMVGLTTPTDGASSIAQSFTAPAGSPALSFWWQGHCQDSVTYGWATATLTDTTTGVTSTPLAKTCVNSTTWRQVTASLTAGHAYTLTLGNQDDNYTPPDPTYTLYDDVTVR